jgi:hypothetical protein
VQRSNWRDGRVCLVELCMRREMLLLFVSGELL